MGFMGFATCLSHKACYFDMWHLRAFYDRLLTISLLHLQVEAALGGQDVVDFCGGLTAVLGAFGVPVHKAVPQAATDGSEQLKGQPVDEDNSQVQAGQQDTDIVAGNAMHGASSGQQGHMSQMQAHRQTEQVCASSLAYFVAPPVT